MIDVHVIIEGRDTVVSLSLDEAKDLRRVLGREIEHIESDQESNPLKDLFR